MRQGQQIFYEDVEEGMELPPLVKTPDTAQLFLFSAVTRNAHRIHYDKEYALSEEHPDLLVQGPLQGATLCSFVTSWMGDDGFLKKFSYSARGRAIPNEALTFKGRVAKKSETNGHHAVELEIWEENGQGDVILPGRAVVYLPSRTANATS
jgi:hydroxyacyl-ACP dehydratase HTD2-like protein with hotdog domain